jgi:hypothetical protein
MKKNEWPLLKTTTTATTKLNPIDNLTSTPLLKPVGQELVTVVSS